MVTQLNPEWPVLARAKLDALPSGPGVYYFYGENGSLLYVGKSVDVRKRVLSHCRADVATARKRALYQQVRDVQVCSTTGELSALLLEAQEIKTLQPLFNRRLRRVSRLYTLQLKDDGRGLFRPEVIEVPKASRQRPMYGLFPSVKRARSALISAGRDSGLCDHVVVTPAPLTGACMGHQLKRCHGLCTGDCSALQHNVTLMTVLEEMALAAWPYEGPVALLERQDGRDEGSAYTLFVLDNWCVLATLSGQGAPDWEQVASTDRSGAFLDRDIYRYLLKAVNRPSDNVRIYPGVTLSEVARTTSGSADR